MVLGSGKTLREARNVAMDTVSRLWVEKGTCITDNTNAIMLVEPGIGIRLQSDSTDFIVVGMCDSKIHHFGLEVGHEWIDFYRNPKSPWLPILEYIGIRKDKNVNRRSGRKTGGRSEKYNKKTD